jgi:hypothetical protein
MGGAQVVVVVMRWVFNLKRTRGRVTVMGRAGITRPVQTQLGFYFVLFCFIFLLVWLCFWGWISGEHAGPVLRVV